MALDTVPWYVGGGAEHSPEIARLLAYAASGGAEGITASTDFLVTTTPTPSTSVQVAAGSATLLNRYAGGSQQAYMARASSVTDVPVTATGSSGGRSDMLVLRVDDPQYSGQTPADVKVGPYVRFEIVQGVSSTATAVNVPYPAIALARIDLPANTATVLAQHIIDVRKVARPQRSRELYITQPTAASSITAAGFTAWTPQANKTIVVPSWATQAKIVGNVSGVRAVSAALVAAVRLKFGTLAGQEIALDMDAETRTTALVAETLTLTAAMRGTPLTLGLEARRLSGTGTLMTDGYSTVTWDVEFISAASAS